MPEGKFHETADDYPPWPELEVSLGFIDGMPAARGTTTIGKRHTAAVMLVIDEDEKELRRVLAQTIEEKIIGPGAWMEDPDEA